MRSLSDKEILEIREFYNSGLYTKTELAEMYNVSKPTIALWLPEQSEFREWKIHYNKLHIHIGQSCKKCRGPLKGHPRCQICTILLHNNQCNHDKKDNRIG